MTALAAQLGAILTARRGDRTRAELAELAGVSNPALVVLEQGRQNPTLERAARMADVYGAELAIVDVEALLLKLDDELEGILPAATIDRIETRLRRFITQEGPTP